MTPSAAGHIFVEPVCVHLIAESIVFWVNLFITFGEGLADIETGD
jgi:hypothetical protein